MQLNSLAAPVAATVETGSIANGYSWADAMNVTVCGIVIVFVMLIFLVLIIMIFGSLMNGLSHSSGKQEKPKQNKPTEAPSSVTAPPVQPTVTVEEDSDEIIAVISAAVSAIYEGTGKKPAIRAIKRADSNGARSAWASAGIFENTRAF